MALNRTSSRTASRSSRSAMPPSRSNRGPAGGSKKSIPAPSATENVIKAQLEASRAAKERAAQEQAAREQAEREAAEAEANSLPRGILAEPADDLELEQAPARQEKLKSSRRSNSSRIIPAASSAKSNRREAGRSSRRGEDDEDDRKSQRGAPPANNSNMYVIGGVVGAVLLLLLVVGLSGGKKSAKNTAAKSTGVEVIPGNPDSYLAKAREHESAGRRLEAAAAYDVAAEIYEKMGRSDIAQQWAMKAYDIRKFTTLNRGR